MSQPKSDVGDVDPGRTARLDGDRAQEVGPAFEVGRAAPSEAFVCRKGAFCDDFEEAEMPSRWTDTFVDNGTLGRGTASASLGKGSLAVTTKDASGASFLIAEKGHVGASWSGAFGFAMRVAAVPKVSLGGPELVVKTADDGVVSLAIVMRPEGLFLEQRSTAECRATRCQAKSTPIAPAKAGSWSRVQIGIEASSSGGAPYGRVEIRVDGGALQATDLTVPLHDGTAVLRAGITSGDVLEAFADLDDVTLLTR